jgi:hypothetical protein
MKKTALVFILLAVLAAPVLADNATFSSPAEGEVWVRGTNRTITYTFSQEISWYALALFRNGTQVGTFSYHNYTYPPKEYNQPWKVGYIEELADLAPAGSGYQIGFICGDSPCPIGISKMFTISIDFSSIFKIKKLFYTGPSIPGGCPQCLILDLASLREELVKLHEPLEVELYWRGKMAAALGRIDKVRGFDAKLQVNLGPDVLAAVNRGEELELRLLGGRNQLLHSQPVRLMASGLVNPRMNPILKH